MYKFFTLPIKRCAILFLCLFSIGKLIAQAPQLVFQPVLSGLSNPTDLVNAADGSNRIFITQQTGTIKVYNQSFGSLGDFLTVPGMTFTGPGDERGLLSLVFHPDYETNRFFYVWYAVTNATTNITSVHLDRFQTFENNPNLADPSSQRGILSINKPVGFTNHNGAKLNFGPDGYLYIGTGDGGSGNDPFENAQNGNSLLGKMLRIAINNSDPPTYSIPGDNPYVSDPNVLDEIWALGLRNPWRWSFDRLTHDMWIGDVGQGNKEEVNFRAAGSTGGINYGWRCFEGFTATPGVPPCSPTNYVPPIFDYTHSSGGVAITGGYVYRGTEYPNLVGYYITCDWANGNFWLLHSDGSNTMQASALRGLTTFGEAENGTLYVTAGGSVYKVGAVAQAPTPVKLVSFTLRQSDKFNDVNWKTASEFNTREFAVESSIDRVSFSEVGKVAASQQANGSTYSLRHFTSNNRKQFYRLKSIDNDGTFELSKIISTNSAKEADPIKVHSSGSSMLVELNAPFHSIRIINAYGQEIYRQPISNATGIIYINNLDWKKGMYVLIATGSEQQLSKKFVVQ